MSRHKSNRKTLDDRIRDDIVGRIRSGAWHPGKRIPFERDFMAKYACSRATVSKALEGVARAGLIERRRRAGSFVSRRVADTAVLDIPDVAAMVAGQGGSYSFNMLRGGARDGRRRCEFRRCRSVEGVHCSNGAPFAYELRYINVAAVPLAATHDFSATAPGPWLLEQAPWSEAKHFIRALAADASLARKLGVEVGAACLELERITWRGVASITHVWQVFPSGKCELSAHFTPRAT